MHLLCQQAALAALSLLGVITLVPGPDRHGKLRIEGPLNLVITYLGIALLLGPWLAMPFLPQPRWLGAVRVAAAGGGALLCAGGVMLYARALRVLLPAFREQYTEFTPSQLVTSGPYTRVRHPIYLACLLIVSGLYLILGACLSIVLLPGCYGLLTAAATYEDKRILLSRFGSQYAAYSAHTRARIIPPGWALAVVVMYLLLAGATMVHLGTVTRVPFIR